MDDDLNQGSTKFANQVENSHSRAAYDHAWFWSTNPLTDTIPGHAKRTLREAAVRLKHVLLVGGAV